MAIIGVTGGIASGKSTFAKLLNVRIDADLFDCDAFVHHLLDSDSDVHEQIRDRFGSDTLTADGKADRARLRERVFAHPAERTALEEILHPRVRSEWTRKAIENREFHIPLIVDFPLLFEKQAESAFDMTVLVGCTPGIQIDRMTGLRGISRETADRILAAQFPLNIKMQRASHIVWNEGTLETLERQADVMAQIVNRHV